MRASRNAVAKVIALAVLAASLAGLWRVLPETASVRLTGDRLLEFSRAHPPKPWRGFEVRILDITVDDAVRIKAHVSGHLIHTPVEITGMPDYDPNAQVMYFRVSKTELPRDASRPMLSRLNSALNPLGTYIAKHITEVMPAKKIKADKPGSVAFLMTVKSVRVDGDAVVAELHGYRAAGAAAAFMFVAFAAVFGLIAAWRYRPPSAMR
jgi:hypothetical protein